VAVASVLLFGEDVACLVLPQRCSQLCPWLLVQVLLALGQVVPQSSHVPEIEKFTNSTQASQVNEKDGDAKRLEFLYTKIGPCVSAHFCNVSLLSVSTIHLISIDSAKPSPMKSSTDSTLSRRSRSSYRPSHVAGCPVRFRVRHVN
jgi:hypothetical protein